MRDSRATAEAQGEQTKYKNKTARASPGQFCFMQKVRLLEGEPSGELEGSGVRTGVVERTEGAGVDVEPDLAVAGVVAEVHGVGDVLAIDSEDELGAIGQVEGAVEVAGEAVETGTTSDRRERCAARLRSCSCRSCRRVLWRRCKGWCWCWSSRPLRPRWLRRWLQRGSWFGRGSQR